MQKELLTFIEENKLSPFSKTKAQIKSKPESVFKTKDARIIHNKVLAKLSENFSFSDTSNLWQFFEFANSLEEIKKRQEFFTQLRKETESQFLRDIYIPKQKWKPKYSIVVVTEDENTLMQLKELGCPVQFLISQYDIESLAEYDTVQVLDCEQFSHVLEKMPQTIFLKSLDEVYLERYLEILSAWQSNLELLQKNETTPEIKTIVSEVSPLLQLLDEKTTKIISKENTEAEVAKINEEIFAQIKAMTLSGDVLLTMLNKGQLPKELKEIMKKAVEKSTLPEIVLELSIPVKIDEKALDSLIKSQSANEFSSIAESIKKHAKALKALPQKLNELSNQILLFDFALGISNYMRSATSMPENAEELSLLYSENLLINSPKPISFCLNEKSKCSMLTGANSGGKTTLLEHIIQLITLFNLGLPIKGNARLPLFSEVYYFAKNKGSMNKGAFETLLAQMSEIKPGKKTLILADEIEAVTEPGVAGKIISATADYFLHKGCFLVIATHLGQEIEKTLPMNARIDGIEAKGLDEFNELIVDHNPVLGRLAHSTPELIIEKMFNTQKTEYFEHLQKSMKK